MRRTIGGAAIALVLALVAVGVLTVRDRDDRSVEVSSGDERGADRPRPLPVLGALADQAVATPADTTAVASESSRVHPGYGGVTYRVDAELPELADEAAAWSVGLEVDDEGVDRLAGALGLDGELEQAEGYRVLRDGEAELVLNGEPGTPWSLTGEALSGISVGSVGGGSVGGGAVTAESPAAVEPSGAVEGEAGSVDGSAGGAPLPAHDLPPAAGAAGEVVTCEMPPCPEGMACAQVCPPDLVEPRPVPERPADVPSVAEAEAQVRALFADIGLDLDGAAVSTVDLFSAVEVRVDPLVGGLPTVGMTWSAVLGPRGELQYAQGWLGTPAEGDRYPLVGTSAAVARLQQAPQAVPAIAIDCAPGAECPDIEPVERTITDARLALQFVPAFGAEEAFLVPSYLFALDDGGEVPAFAIADEHLVAPPVPEGQSTEPAAPPLAGGDEPVSSPPSEGAASGPATTFPREQQQCSTAESDRRDGNEPLVVELCVSVAPAGEGTVVTLVADDPDAAIFDDGDGCTVGVSFTGGEGLFSCEYRCASPSARPTPGPGNVAQTFRHVFDEPGEHQVEAAVASGHPCTPSTTADEVRLEATITVP